jgi:branched-chain amino acid transport system substrate-binding protein
MRKGMLIATCLSVAVVTGLSACSSSKSGGASGSGSGAAVGSTKGTSGDLKVGLLSDFTGAASSGFTTTKQGVEAYINSINDAGGVNGQKIDLVEGDTTSTPTGALTAVQKLVQNDKVFAIIENSSVFYGAENYALKKGVPVVGSAIDGPIWFDSKNTNLFNSAGIYPSDTVPLSQGQYEKKKGVTGCASLGYSDSVSAQDSAKGFVQSCEAAGIKTAYLNVQVPSSTTDVGSIALAIKNSGADGISTSLRPNTSFALVAALKQLGVNVKSFLLLTGYGSDLLASAPSVQVAQGVDFSTLGYPAETSNAATDLRKANLAKVGAASPPTFGEQYGYLAAVAFVDGLKAAGANPSQSSFISKMRAITDFDGEGLLPFKVNFGDYNPATSCTTVSVLTGKTFVPDKDTPLCAPLVALKK